MTMRDVYGVAVPYAAHAAIRRLRRRGHEPSIHGTKIWTAGKVLIEYLKSSDFLNPGTSVVDAGCGWGLSSIWCRKHADCDVLSVDADPDVFPYLNVISELNQTQTTHRVARFEELTVGELGDYDYLIGADICFWESMIDPVSRLIDTALEAEMRGIVIADPERPPFCALAEQCLERHGGELIEWELTESRGRGVVLVINND